MNKKELDEYCLSLGLVRQQNLCTLWYGYTYPFKYSSPNSVIVGFQVSFKEAQGKPLNETVKRTIKVENKVAIVTEYKAIACYEFGPVEDRDE